MNDLPFPGLRFDGVSWGENIPELRYTASAGDNYTKNS